MHRRYGLLILLTVLVILAGAYASIMAFRPSELPFTIDTVNAHTGVIEPVAGVPLPSGIEAGDQIDLAAQPRSTRIAIAIIYNLGNLPLGRTYGFVIHRDGAWVTIPVTSVGLSTGTGVRWFAWTFLGFFVLLSAIALLALWRGRDRASAGMTVWAITFLAGIAVHDVPSDGRPGLSVALGSIILYLFARVGFYLLVESMVGSALTPRARALWRGSFLLLLGVGAAQVLGGLSIFVATGWAELLRSQYGFALTASYLLPVVLLFVSYRHADKVRRLRLRWMLWSSVAFVAGVFLNNTPLLGLLASYITYGFMFVIAMAGFLYAVLRHRVVDVSVVLDHTLVYGGLTALVVGVLAAVNSLVEHAALGTSASLLLQVIVPLALGIVLSRVRMYLDRIVEQVFFRKKYLAEKALRRFARNCIRYERTHELMQAAALEIRQQLGAPGVAIYERRSEGYICVQHAGERRYPEHIRIDDSALVAARADQKNIDLSELTSEFGTDGYVLPMTVQGVLQGVLVCANRPGEHYAVEERKLIIQVARQVGIAWQSLLARDNQAFVRAVAHGDLKPDEAQAQARKLAAAWAIA